MSINRTARDAWHYYRGSWVLPTASVIVLVLAVRDALIPTVPVWVPMIEFPLFVFAIFSPFIDGARREERWHVARGSARYAAVPAKANWWVRQIRFAIRQFRQPWFLTLLAGKVLLLLLVGWFAPGVVNLVALAPDVVALAAIVSILGSNWRRQGTWDRLVPTWELPNWAGARQRKRPITTSVAGLALAITCCGMAFYFLALGDWPVEFLCGLQGFWLLVSSLRTLSPAAPWRRTYAPPAAPLQSDRSAA